MAWSQGPLRWGPMTVRERVRATRGMTANGMPKLSTTCERTRVQVASAPTASRTIAGIRVTTRRTSRGIRRWISPSMIVAPA